MNDTIWTPSARAHVITRRTYNRPLENGGFETWEQTIDRVILHQRWLWERARGEVPLTQDQLDELAELRSLMLTRKVMPAGRTLWLGGTEIARRRESSMFNPGRRSTRFITKQGVKSFEDFEDGDHVETLTHLGNWKRARVVKAGVQPINKITFSRGRNEQVEYFTPTHTWILKDGSRTTELKEGDHIWSPPIVGKWSYDEAPIDERFWWACGYVYGDGAVVTQANGTSNSRVRLCGDDKMRYLPRFEELGFSHSFPPSCDNDPIVYTGRYLKTLPPDGTEPRLLRAFIYGYLAADGAKSSNFERDGMNEYLSIQATNPEAQAFIEKYFPAAGLYIINKNEVAGETNLAMRSNPTFNYRISVGFGEAPIYGNYKVRSIEPQGDEEVWCLTVDDDHSFVLPNGVVTGNCSFTRVESVYDLVDVFWLLLQGCGVGFEPIAGCLNGFTHPAEIEVVRSQRHLLVQQRGRDATSETIIDGVWRLTIGDSAEAWAKSVGKLLAMKRPFSKLILDFSQIRPAGFRLKGYGWISSGDEMLCKALVAICGVLNRRAGQLLTRIDILDIVNWLGTTLSSRRSAEIALIPYGDPEWRDFAMAKKDHWVGNPQRAQSNNSLVFFDHPGHAGLVELFDMMQEGGGSEPGLVNAQEALRRAPWFKGVNPCGEIMLPNKGFCNLVETNLARFNGEPEALKRAIYLIARANYRQTCVNLEDGILQRAWHENNEFLRLCGVGVTGVVKWEGQHSRHRWKTIREIGRVAADSMADELGTPRAKAVTTVKPSGTVSKIMDTSEGVHRPLGRFIFNNIRFSAHDPILGELADAGYHIFPDPYANDGMLVRFPVENADVEFEEANGVGVNLEPAVAQLTRYKRMMEGYVDHNCSNTINYSPDEVPQIVAWLNKNWNSYVGVSFLHRTDPTKTAADLGFPFLPQEVVDEATFRDYTRRLKPLYSAPGVEIVGDISKDGVELSVDVGECATGACPVR